MDIGQTLLASAVRGEGGGVLERCAALDHGRAMPARILDLHRRGSDRHEDGCGNRKRGRVIGHPLCVVSRRGGYHTAPPFIGGQRRQPVERATLLERRCELQVFELEPYGRARDIGQRTTTLEAGPRHESGEHAGRRLDVAKGNRQPAREVFDISVMVFTSLEGGLSERHSPRMRRRNGWWITRSHARARIRAARL